MRLTILIKCLPLTGEGYEQRDFRFCWRSFYESRKLPFKHLSVILRMNNIVKALNNV